MRKDGRIPADERPAALAHRRFAEQRAAFRDLGMAARFTRIHDVNLWGAPTSVSGLGSEPAATARLGEELGRLLRALGVATLLDAPCGDAGWMGGVDLRGVDYIGVDIVPALVAALATRQRPAGVYRCLDLTVDPLPRADAILCRDCLVHLSFASIAAAAANFRRSGARWLIATTFTALDANRDGEDGDWRPLDMTLAPFGWPAPQRLIVEGCDEDGGGWADKSLGVWELATLPASG